VGFNAYNPAYDEYDFSYGQYGQGRSVHSSWFGVLAEMGYPGIVFYGLLIALAIRNCHRARKETAGKPGRSALSLYAGAFETSLWIFIVGGTFLPFQYNEMLFHVIGLSIALRILASRDAPGENPQLPPDLAPGERVGIR
jgi:O-antigen ligase